ncbi:DUF6151 family protein [uncultured Alsobacter sp.]|uniref:DUF6151 family protein n=1 Tax=uncultured Alsobacter sp. TaxID=1748258 RepID=UPI0025D5A09D|nr:DUF6151 family protein [uncultured Alsobacter sp.]
MVAPIATMSCRCGTVRGTLTGATPDSVNRAVCYCDDCQAFAHWLSRADLLDAHGGSDIVQFAPGAFTIDSGHDAIACVRLGPQGIFRFYATCCKTPVGNTVKPSIPFIGVPVQAFGQGAQEADRTFGRPAGRIMARFAIGQPPDASQGIGAWLMLRAVAKVLWWRLSGRSGPHPLMSRDTGEPLFSVTVLSRQERDSLRPLCGPHPTASAPAASTT